MVAYIFNNLVLHKQAVIESNFLPHVDQRSLCFDVCQSTNSYLCFLAVWLGLRSAMHLLSSLHISPASSCTSTGFATQHTLPFSTIAMRNVLLD